MLQYCYSWLVNLYAAFMSPLDFSIKRLSLNFSAAQGDT